MALSQSHTTTDECKHCDAPIDEFYAPGYCSESCYHAEQAEKVLEVVRRDHRLCGTCLGAIKEIEPPSEDWEHEHGSPVQTAIAGGAEYHNVDGAIALDTTECHAGRPTSTDSVIGFEYRTELGEGVVKQLETDDGRRYYQAGVGCSCGNVHASQTEDVLRECNPARALANTIRTVRLLEAEGKINKRVDKETFFETYRETSDFDVALGQALYEP